MVDRDPSDDPGGEDPGRDDAVVSDGSDAVEGSEPGDDPGAGGDAVASDGSDAAERSEPVDGPGAGGDAVVSDGSDAAERSEPGDDPGAGGDAVVSDGPDTAARGGGRRRARRTDTDDPRRSRERALKILFQSDLRGVEPDGVLEQLRSDPAARAMLDDADELTDAEQLAARARGGEAADPPAPSRGRAAGIDGFTRALVLGVAEHRDEVDALIARFARRWQIHRMPVVDRTVLRLATYELLYETTPPAVVIDQAVTLAKALSTDDSGRYVNGVLESIRKDVAGRERPSA
jgi:transcription antitermination factor NusB